MVATAQLLHNRYRVRRTLGEGGCGQVFEAFDTSLNRTVALKRLHPQAGLSLQQRFAAEAEILARLSHPHVIEIFDRFEEGGAAYQVMPYADGGSLADLLGRSAYAAGLPIDDVIAIGKSLAGALRAAHAADVTHRDVKPSNVLLFKTPEGNVVKLADFGVAAAERDAALTATGEVIGTPNYLAPEQVRGYPAGFASDVYALGIVLYRLLTNRHYLDLQGDEMEKRRRILEAAPPAPAAVRSETPAWLNDLVLRMLAKAAADRPTAAAVYDALQRAGRAEAKHPADVYHTDRVAPPVAPPRRPAPGSARLAWALVAALLTVALFIWGDLPTPADFPRGAWPNWSALPTWAVELLQPATARLREALGTLSAEPPADVAPAPPAQPVYAVVVGTAPARGLRLRAEPNLAAAIRAVLPEGAVVEVLAFRDYESWVLVDAGPSIGSGWVYGAYLRLVDR